MLREGVAGLTPESVAEDFAAALAEALGTSLTAASADLRRLIVAAA